MKKYKNKCLQAILDVSLEKTEMSRYQRNEKFETYLF